MSPWHQSVTHKKKQRAVAQKNTLAVTHTLVFVRVRMSRVLRLLLSHHHSIVALVRILQPTNTVCNNLTAPV